MTRKATRRAIEWPRMILGLTLCAFGYWLFSLGGGDIGPALFVFGLVLSGIACLGRGCNLCGKTLNYREFGFSPARADEVTATVGSHDVDRVIALLASPRIGDLERPRTALAISCCPRCQQIAEILVGEYGDAFHTRTEATYSGPDVARLYQAVRTTRKQRR